MKLVASGLVLVGMWIAARPAAACIPIANQPFVLDPAHAGDTTPPTPITVCDWFALASKLDDCGAAGTFWIYPDSTDDATPADELGYVFNVVGEQTPGAPRATHGGALLVGFDIDEDIEERIVSIRPVDLNGNQGKAMRCTVTWRNPDPETDDGDGGGCASTRGGGWLAALALLGLRRRRR